MSIIHTLEPEKPLDIAELNNFSFQQKNAVVEDRGEGVFYYWIDGESTRGFDITLENGSMEIRNTIMSNFDDYNLTNELIRQIQKMTGAPIYDEDGAEVNSPLFDNAWIRERQQQDCETLHIISNDHGEIAIFGPKRKVFFGQNSHKNFEKLNPVDREKKMFELIKKVNYNIPDYDYGNVLQTTISGEEKILKVLTNSCDYIVDKYDYILLHREPKNPIIITNEILNQILPDNWELVDEFTIVAPRLNYKSWQKLLADATFFDQWQFFEESSTSEG